ncbi:hypothetical protein HMPREF9997_00674 [Corynebacterium durum F0235]|uniref:Uncharacterized protein n=1 Tax=Corynebacterium durum F0235 TaxID=1035195 RepID=L1MKM4_9CORY|nr:hypothetical protein HMPREF9997_00674 [Corynebacterium durum F0235]
MPHHHTPSKACRVEATLTFNHTLPTNTSYLSHVYRRPPLPQLCGDTHPHACQDTASHIY